MISIRQRRFLASLAIPLLCVSTLSAQSVKGRPRKDAPPRTLDYRGVVPGVTTVDRVRAVLGEPAHEAEWYAWKMLYAAPGFPGRFDAIHLQGETAAGGRVGTIETVSVPQGYGDLDALRGRLGAPGYHLTLPSGQHVVDYSEKGVRFTLDSRLRTIGVAHFPHGWPRVHSGARRRVDLRHLVQGARRVTARAPSVSRLSAGAAEIDISPTMETYPKLLRIVTPLKARCAVFSRGGMRVAVVGADLFGMLKSEVDPIEAKLRESGIDHLLFAMSHNHAAPDSIGIYGSYPKAFVESIQQRVVEGVLAALGNERPVARLRMASRDLSLRGARVEGLFRNARNPGLVDPQIACVQALDGEDEPIVTLVHFACHVEGISKGDEEITADFPGYLCDGLRERTGAQAVFLNGALGGMVSGDTRARTHEQAKAKGERLAAEVESLLEIATPSVTDALGFERERLEVPVTNLRFIAFQRLYPGRRPEVRGRLVTEMFHLRLGDAELLTIPGELLPEISFELLEKMTGYPRMIVGLANDQLGYIIPAYDFRTGFYEESMSVGPAIGPLVKECGWRMLRGRD